MKSIFTLIITILCFQSLSYSQWTTLYEGGFGTPNNLETDWVKRYYFEGNGNDNSLSLTSSTPDTNRAQLLYYFSDFRAGSMGIFKQIPNMENYVSLRIYLEMDLPDSVGTIHYASLSDNTFTDISGNPIWNEFASNQLNTTIPFSNTQGDNTIYLFADLLRGDSVRVRFNYVRIEADTTQMASLSEFSTETFQTYSANQTVFINVNSSERYHFYIYNASGQEIYSEACSGNKALNTPFETGIYNIRIVRSNGTIQQDKVFIE